MMPMTRSGCLMGMLIIGMFAVLSIVSKIHWWWICKRNKPRKGGKKTAIAMIVFSALLVALISICVMKPITLGIGLDIIFAIGGFVFLVWRSTRNRKED